ncbi:MAG TPA: hypothetical protein VH599_17710 [Ktedonobacterales bacterium]|jgi:hypothetical protein
MPGPHDPNYTSSAGLVLRDEGEETGNPTSTKEEGTVKGSRTLTRFWLVMATLLLGLAALVIGFIFFSAWPGVLASEAIGAGLALLASCVLLLTGVRRDDAHSPASAADASDTAIHQPAEPSPAALPAPPVLASTATREAPAAPTIAPMPERAPESAAPGAEQREASAPAAPPTTPEPASIPPAEPAAPHKPTRPKTDSTAQNGHAATAEAISRASRPQARDDTPVPMPPLTNLPQSYPRPSGGYSLDTEAEDLSQLLGDVAEQTVIAAATRGKRGVERRERMASKIDAFSQEMAADPNFAPVVAFLESISALLRAGAPIPASQELVDPFDGLYGYVLTLIRRKTGKTHD